MSTGQDSDTRRVKQEDPSPTEPIGEVDTPLEWALWAAERYGLIDRWIDGATVLDPTMGEGNLLEAFLWAGQKRGIPIDRLPVHTLFGIERRGEKIQCFHRRVEDRYHLQLPRENFVEGDILAVPSIPPVDILFGNPPWITFAALPDTYKNRIRELFLRYGLVKSRNHVLLGRSRVDLSALVVLVSMSRYLRQGGEAVFFLPLSLFFGEGAGEGFRRFCSEGISFHVRELVELPVGKVFPGVSTRGGVVHLKRDEEQRFPVPVYRMGRDRWNASPVDGPASSWILHRGEHPFPGGIPRIPVPPDCIPRQGINTCGANDLFIFDSAEEEGEGVMRVSNSTHSALLPSRYLFPLLTGENFRSRDPCPHRWVFLPYQQDGRPLSSRQIQEDPLLHAYLESHRERLSARKGVLIQKWIRKGYFWALFGVGGYSFHPWKIVWEAAGRKRFSPILWDGRWQANQSLHGYLPFRSLPEAERVLESLLDPRIESYLLALQAQGTLNWAQPGRMRRLFTQVSSQGISRTGRRD